MGLGLGVRVRVRVGPNRRLLVRSIQLEDARLHHLCREAVWGSLG